MQSDFAKLQANMAQHTKHADCIKYLWLQDCQTLSAKQHAIHSTLVTNLAMILQHALLSTRAF